MCELRPPLRLSVTCTVVKNALVSVGIDHDRATFAVRLIRPWWQRISRPVYRGANALLITADAGGSNALASASGNGNCNS